MSLSIGDSITLPDIPRDGTVLVGGVHDNVLVVRGPDTLSVEGETGSYSWSEALTSFSPLTVIGFLP